MKEMYSWNSVGFINRQTLAYSCFLNIQITIKPFSNSYFG